MLQQFGLCAGKNGGHFCNTYWKQLKSVTSMELEQRDIIKFLHLKGLELQETAPELSSAYSQDASARPSIDYHLHQIKLTRTRLQAQHVGGRPPLDDVDTEISSLIREFPFPSVRTITDSQSIPACPIYSHLVQRIGPKTFPTWLGSPHVN
jgi:hypothetical protein